MYDYASMALCGNSMIAKRHSMSMGDEIFSIVSWTANLSLSVYSVPIRTTNADSNTPVEEIYPVTQLTFENKQIYDQLEMGKVEGRWMKPLTASRC